MKLFRKLQTNDPRFRVISTPISATSVEKMDRYTKLRTTSGTMNMHQQSSPLGDHKYGEIHYHKEKKTNGGQRIEFSEESVQFERKKIKSGNQ